MSVDAHVGGLGLPAGGHRRGYGVGIDRTEKDTPARAHRPAQTPPNIPPRRTRAPVIGRASLLRRLRLRSLNFLSPARPAATIDDLVSHFHIQENARMSYPSMRCSCSCSRHRVVNMAHTSIASPEFAVTITAASATVKTVILGWGSVSLCSTQRHAIG
jgi:hypothetical protein